MNIFKSKTMWFSSLLIIFGALMDNSVYLKDLISPQYFSFVMIVIGIIVGILRSITTQPLADK
jgi:uncharacterized membrane protein (DUF106 family)